MMYQPLSLARPSADPANAVTLALHAVDGHPSDQPSSCFQHWKEKLAVAQVMIVFAESASSHTGIATTSMQDFLYSSHSSVAILYRAIVYFFVPGYS